MAAPGVDLLTSNFDKKNSRNPNDTVFYAIIPDCSVLNPTASADSLVFLRQEIMNSLDTFTSEYVWQHQHLDLSIPEKPSCLCFDHLPHLHGKLRFGQCLDDEWFTVFLLYQISKQFKDLSIRIWDSDGQFLVDEVAFHLPCWIISGKERLNRVFIRNGELRIIPRDEPGLQNPTLTDSLNFMIESPKEHSIAITEVQLAVNKKISQYPGKSTKNTHVVRVRVPASVAQVLSHEPGLISLAVEGFYYRDQHTMKYARKMKRFLRWRQKEYQYISVKMSREMHAQLVRPVFQAPNCYQMPDKGDPDYMQAELGMKIACGFEMMYQYLLKQALKTKGTWEPFRKHLESSAYSNLLLPGANEYHDLMRTLETYYKRNSSRAREIMSAPVRSIDKILELDYFVKDPLKGKENPSSEDITWLSSEVEEYKFAS